METQEDLQLSYLKGYVMFLLDEPVENISACFKFELWSCTPPVKHVQCVGWAAADFGRPSVCKKKELFSEKHRMSRRTKPAHIVFIT